MFFPSLSTLDQMRAASLWTGVGAFQPVVASQTRAMHASSRSFKWRTTGLAGQSTHDDCRLKTDRQIVDGVCGAKWRREWAITMTRSPIPMVSSTRRDVTGSAQSPQPLNASENAAVRSPSVFNSKATIIWCLSIVCRFQTILAPVTLNVRHAKVT